MPMTTNNWQTRFLALADHISTWSKDPDRKVGSVIVGPHNEVRAMGYNGLPRGADDTVAERFVKPAKHRFFEHSERNAIYNAARTGTSTEGCTLYSSFCPCYECSRAIVQSGITTVVAPTPDFTLPIWGEQFVLARELFHEVGVRILYV